MIGALSEIAFGLVMIFLIAPHYQISNLAKPFVELNEMGAGVALYGLYQLITAIRKTSGTQH